MFKHIMRHSCESCLPREVLIASLLAMSVCAPVQAQGWQPMRPIELIVPGTAGGGLDRTVRAVQKVFQDEKLINYKTTVLNKSGGGGAVAQAYLKQRAGMGEYLDMASTSLITNSINGTSQFRHTDFTPIANVSSEYLVFVVKPDSPIKDVKSLLTRLQADPNSLSFGIATSRGNHQHVAVAAVAKAAGVEAKRAKVVVFNSSTDAITSILGGHIDVSISTTGNVLGHVQAGRLRLLGVTSPKRLTGVIASVPTMKEAGVNTQIDSWRGFIGPPGMTAPQIAYWDQAFAALTKSEVWKKELEASQQMENYLNSREMKAFLDEQYAEYKEALTELGVIQ